MELTSPWTLAPFANNFPKEMRRTLLLGICPTLCSSKIWKFSRQSSQHTSTRPCPSTKMVADAVCTEIHAEPVNSWYFMKSLWSGVKCIEAPESRIYSFLLWSYAHLSVLWEHKHKSPLSLWVDTLVSTGVTWSKYNLLQLVFLLNRLSTFL